MSKIIIESTNKNDSVTDIEEKLEKAYTSIRMQRENKQFSDVYDRWNRKNIKIIIYFLNKIEYNKIEKIERRKTQYEY